MSNALLGMAILLSAFLILNTVNPELVQLREPRAGRVVLGSKAVPDPLARGPKKICGNDCGVAFCAEPAVVVLPKSSPVGHTIRLTTTTESPPCRAWYFTDIDRCWIKTKTVDGTEGMAEAIVKVPALENPPALWQKDVTIYTSYEPKVIFSLQCPKYFSLDPLIRVDLDVAVIER